MKKGQGLPFEVPGKLLEIIYISIFTVWQFQFIFVSSSVKLVSWFIRLINAPVSLLKLPLGRDITELTVENGRISDIQSI